MFVNDLFKNKKITEGSMQDRLHRRHQELRKKSGLPDPEYYRELKASYDIADDAKRLAHQAEIKKKYQVAEATGDKQFDAMMKKVAKTPTQAQRNAERIRQKREREEETRKHFANGGGFGPSPADKLSVRKGVAEAFTDDVGEIYAMHPQPEKSEKIVFRIKDMDADEFSNAWESLPNDYLNEFGYDSPLWDTDDLSRYPHLKVQDVTFDQYVKLVGNYIRSDDMSQSAMSALRKGVAEGMFGIDPAIKGKIQNITMDLSDIPGYWDHEQQTFTDMGLAKLKAILKKPEYVKYALNLTSDDYDADLNEGVGNLAQALDKMSGGYWGWHQDEEESRPDLAVYHFDDGEGGNYATGIIKHNLRTDKVYVKFDDRADYYGANVDQIFPNIGAALKSLSFMRPEQDTRGRSYDVLATREPVTPDDLYKSDRVGRKGALSGGAANRLKDKIRSAQGRLGPKGELPRPRPRLVYSKQDMAEAGPFSYGAKKHRKGSVADLAAKKRREQEKNKKPIEPRDQMVGTARVIKDVAEGRKQDFNFDIEDIKKLETIRDLPTLRAQAMALISRPSARPMKPEKVAWFDAVLDRMDSPLKIIKLMYDLLLSGEGHAVIGSKNTMKANTYRDRFGESSITNEDIEGYIDEMRRAGYDIVTEATTLCPECGGTAYDNQMLAEKQDACYHKVKSRYKVWPSAYASGALVRCRKVGAKNWGNKSKK